MYGSLRLAYTYGLNENYIITCSLAKDNGFACFSGYATKRTGARTRTDEGVKRGIMEMSDMIAITKADGNNVEKASMARALYANALHLFPPTESTWVPTALTSSSVTKEGLPEILEKIEEYFALVKGNGYYERKRREQARYWMYESINESLKNSFYENPTIEKLMGDYETAVLEGKLESFIAAGELLERYRNLEK